MNPIEHNMGTDSVERSIGVLIGKIDGVQIAVQSMGGEVKSLRDDFASMEKGRLSRLEVSFATLDTEVQIRSKANSMWYAAIMSCLTSIISGVVLYFLLNK